MFDVLTIGDAVEDIFIRPQQGISFRELKNEVLTLRQGSKIEIKEALVDVGGCAANVAVGLSRLEIKSAVLAPLGEDEAAKRILKKFQDESISKKYLKQSSKYKSSFSVIILVDEERTIFTYHGLDDYSVLKLPQRKLANWYYLAALGEGWEKVLKNVVEHTAKYSINLAFNPGMLQLEAGVMKLSPLLRVTKILFVNELEARELTRGKKYEIKEMLTDIRRLGPEIVVITEGKKGANLYDGKKFYHIEVYPAQEVEVTGAGDAFAAGFLAAKINGEDNLAALKWAVIEAALCTEAIGAQTNLPTLKQMQKELKNKAMLHVRPIE